MTTHPPNEMFPTEIVTHFRAAGDTRNYPHTAVMSLGNGKVEISFGGYNEEADIVMMIPQMEYVKMIERFRDIVRGVKIPAEHQRH